MAFFSAVAGTDIPLDNLSYDYVRACNNAKEIGAILNILRSGKEGHYPDLIAFTEKKLSELDPTSKLLIKDKPASRMADLPHEKVTALNNDLQQWANHVNTESSTLSSDKADEDTSIPPIRTAGTINKPSQTSPTANGSSQPSERIKSSDYDSWSKFNTEKEAEKVDTDVSNTPNTSTVPNIPCELSEKERNLPSAEKERMAVREKEKGNEAYRAGDVEEAFSYYSRSLQFNPSVPAYNNRAITQIKLKRYEAAIEDCSRVLQLEPNNTKGLLRRGTAYTYIKKLQEAANDFEQVLRFEPNNKKAQQELNELRKMSDVGNGGGKKKGHRVQIEEEDEDSTEGTSRDETTPTNIHSATPDEAPPPMSGSQFPPSDSVSSLPATAAQDPTPPPLPPQVQALKNTGNEMFRAGQYADAAKNYSFALALLKTGDQSHVPNLSMLLNNLAACHLKIGDCQSCISECTQSLALVPVNIKALVRRAQANEHLERYKHAYNDYQLALSIDRTLTVAYQATSRITRLLRELEGNAWREKLPPNPDAARVREELQRMARSFSGELRGDSSDVTADGQVADTSVTEDQGGIQFTAHNDCTTESEGQRSSEPISTSDVPPPPMETTDPEYPAESAEDNEYPAESAEDDEYPPGSLQQDTETSSVDYEPQDIQFKDTSLPESVSSDSVGTDTSTYDTSNSVDDSSEGTESTTPPTPPIDITTTAPGSAETKVTQSTQSVPSPRTSAPPSPKVKEDLLSPEEKFERHKLKGNEHVKKGEYLEALRYYSMCVSLCPNRTVGYTNRALCHLKLNSPRNAEDDCNKALSHEPGNLKALYRRGLARKDLQRYGDSLKDLKILLAIDSENAVAKREYTEIKQLWEKQLRDLQAKASSSDGTRAERRQRERRRGTNPKSKAGKSRSGPQSPGLMPDMDDPELDENVKKLLENIKKSKASIEKLAKLAPGTSWGNAKGGLGDFPFSGPPRTGTTKGKPPNTGRSPTNAKRTSTTSANDSVGGASGKSPKSRSGKGKKVPKKPPKPTKEKPEETPSQPRPQTEPSDLISPSQATQYNKDETQSQGDTKPEVKGQSSPPSRGKRIVIEEVDSESNDERDEATPTATVEDKVDCESVETTPPTKLQSPFEFVQRWNAIPRKAQSSEYARLLEAIPPLALPDMITNKLDGIMLTNIIRAIDKQFVPTGKYQLSVDILTSLSKVPRFGMIAMFMGQTEKSDLSKVISALSSQSPDPIPPSTIDNLKQLYGL